MSRPILQPQRNMRISVVHREHTIIVCILRNLELQYDCNNSDVNSQAIKQLPEASPHSRGAFHVVEWRDQRMGATGEFGADGL